MDSVVRLIIGATMLVRLFIGATMLVCALHASGQTPAHFTTRDILPAAFTITMNVCIIQLVMFGLIWMVETV